MTEHPNEHGGEPIRGLPAHLPEGEHILWQGAPDWRVLARTALHVRVIAAYFAVIAVWRVAAGWSQGRDVGGLAMDVLVVAVIGAAAVALLAGYAWLAARTTVYTLTNRRFVLRHGVALSKIFQVPYRRIESAGIKVDAAGVGDIPLRLTPESKIAYPHLWPHARPWRIVHPEPMMRAVPDAQAVAELLTEAWRGEVRERARMPATAAAPARRRRRDPAGEPAAA